MTSAKDTENKTGNDGNIVFESSLWDVSNETGFFESLVDPAWYLNRYEDVARSGMDPVKHYIQFGRFEGRVPYKLDSLLLESKLWEAQNPDKVLRHISGDLGDKDRLNASVSAWVLARWYGHLKKWGKVFKLMPHFFDFPPALKVINHQGPFLLLYTASIELDQKYLSFKLLEHPEWPETADKELARSLLLKQDKKLAFLGNIWKKAEVSHDTQTLDMNKHPDIDNICVRQRPRIYKSSDKGRPLVSVIIPVYNASSTIDTAIRSLLSQTWKNIEILAVDDNSSDDSVEKIKNWQKKDNRISLIRQRKNNGTYVCRNVGLAAAKGRFVTTHDSDDWSHPDKILIQASSLIENPDKTACFSDWVRCENDLNFGTGRWRTENSWIYRNISSLMYRKEIVEHIGFWDSVSVSGDTEYYERILRVFGTDSIINVLPGIPLSLGRTRSTSLSFSKETHLRTLFSGIRKDYHDATREWHLKTPKNDLILPCFPKKRRFPVPRKMVRGGKCHIYHNRFLLLKKYLETKIPH